MRGTQLSLRHLLGAGALSSSLLLAGLTFASLPAGAQSATSQSATMCPDLSLGNPNPGDNLQPGGLVISGEASDPAAPAGTSGIERVDLFLGLRDEGGTILGSATPGANSNENPRAFTTEVSIPSGLNRGDIFAAYAISSITGQETSVSFPVFIGNEPKNAGLATPTPVPTGETVTSTCAAGVAAPVPVAAPSGNASPSGSASAATTGTQCPVLSLANPNPGDDLLAGGLIISGTATDPSGVQRVDLFLGDRDQGGMFLGSAVPGTMTGGGPDAFSIEVSVPNLGKAVDFAAYAIGDNGQQTTVTFPIFVGNEPVNTSAVATPTPVPTMETVTSSCNH